MNMKDLKSALKEKSTQRAQKCEGDYYKDYTDGLGLMALVCGKCGAFKESYPSHPMFGKNAPLRNNNHDCERDARLEAERVEREKRERDEYEKAQLEHRKEQCFGNMKRLYNWTFKNADYQSMGDKLWGIVEKYAGLFPDYLEKGQGIMFYGNVGTGKTYAAAMIANSLLEDYYSVRMVTLPRLVNEINENWDDRNEKIDALCELDLLIIDDIGAERESDYMNEQVLQVIDARYLSGKPLIVTTNLGDEDFTSVGSMARARIFSRLREMCAPVAVTGADRRV